MEHSAVFSFSASSRLIACPASRRMSRGVPNSTNPQAELGTAAHDLGEFSLSIGLTPSECIDMTFNNHVVDDYMADAVTVYTSYVNSICKPAGVKPMLEKRVTMTSLGRNDVFGTSDCIIVIGNTLYVIDYKHGYGLVDVANNTQLIAYAIATLDTLNLWSTITTVVTTIVQPRASHIDGPIRSHSYSVSDLRNVWHPIYVKAVADGEDPTVKPVAGDHCKYCPARANCRARMERTLQFAYTDTHLDDLSLAELEVFYRESESIKTWLEAVAGRMLDEARHGKQFEGYKLVNGITRAKVDDEAGLVAEAGELAEELYEKKLKSMTAVKKILPAKIVNKYYVKPPAQTTLVKLTDNRPAISVGNAAGIFTPVE